MSPEERAARGARYQELLAGGEITDALNTIERQYVDEWSGCFDPAGRESLWQAVQVVRKIKAHFGQLAGDGKMASHQLAELKRMNPAR